MLVADFSGPSINDFFPPALLFAGTPFEVNRVTVIRLLATAAILLVFGLGTRRMKLVPSRWQSIVEMGLEFVRVNIAEDLLGKRNGQRFLPLLTTIFFMVLFFNLTSVVPGLNMAGTAVIGVPLILAFVTYGTFIYAGIRNSPRGFFRNILFPPGVPWPLYIIVTPIEVISTFIVRPVTLILRLMMNMVVGHLLLVLFFSGTEWFLFEAPALLKFFGIGTMVFALAFTLMELLVAVLQAYIFALLTGVYIQLAISDSH